MTTQSKEDRAGLTEAGDRATALQEAIRLKRAAARSKPAGLSSRPADEPARLGELQRSLWLLHRLEPASPAYNLASTHRVSGALEPGRLERGWNAVVSRHRILRSTFRRHRDGALQVVHPHSELAVERIETSGGEALATAAREARRPFDLETGPLVRLLRVEAPDERLLVLVLHHILADERSLGLLWRELAEGYAGRKPATAQPPQYDDYVHWQSGRDPNQRAADLDFWRRRLEPFPEDLQLPFEGPAGGEAGGVARGRLLSRSLDSGIRDGIQRLAAEVGTTPFAVHAFAFRLLLHRYTEGRDVAFATPAARRSHPATAEMIGYFLNPTVIRAPIDEQRSVEPALRDFSGRLRDALARASVPFDVLVEELAPPRRRHRHPIFQTMFVYQEAPAPPELAGVRLEPITLDLGASKFDLTLFASDVAAPSAAAPDGGRSLEIAVEYRADRFDEVWMQGLLDHYQTLIERLADDLTRPVAEVPMLPPGEARRLDANAGGTPTEATGATAAALLPRQIFDQARRSPRAPAVIAGDPAWSWAELEGAAVRIARELTARGVRPGDRVALYLDRTPWMIAGLLGCHWAGAAYVPLDPAYPSARNLEVLDDAEVAAILTRSAVADGLPAGSTPAIDVEGLEGDPAEDWQPAEIRPEHPAYLLYTSGSTGRPKGVVVTHANLRASNEARFRAYDVRPQRFLLLPSIAFDSSVAGLFWTLAAGGTLVIPTEDEARDPRRLARRMIDARVDSLLCVPSLYAHILGFGQDRLRDLEAVIVAGERCPPPLVAEHFRVLPETRLFNEYGPTEATVWATVHEMKAGDSAPVAIGRPIPGVRVEVLDALRRRVPAGIPGEGWISGPTVADGYWRRPELTEERFVRLGVEGGAEERRYRTGDRLQWTTGGTLLFLGRADEQIKLRGFRIEPGEIEAALAEHANVREAAVVVRDGEQLVAFVETGAPLTRDLREELAGKLPEFMVPGRVVELPSLPKLPNGKVDRGRLRKMPLAAEAETRATETASVLDDRHRLLLSLWEGLLGRSGISLDDNFFRLGGHSLLAVEMTSAIERDFGALLAPAEVFQHPTVRQLARRIEQQGEPGAPAYAHLFPIQPSGHGAPFLFCVPHFFTEMAAARFRGQRPVYGLRGISLRPEGNRGRWRTMADLGADLVEEIARRFPDRSYVLAGYSFGATMAVEAARQMEERGMPVERLYLIAPMAVDHYRLGPLSFRLDGLRQPARELSSWQALGRFARDNHPLRRRPYQRLRWLLAVQPWRRLLCLFGRLRTLAGLPLTPRILYADVRLERFRLHVGYRPGTLRVPTVIFNAREPATDAAATWRPFFAGPFDVVETPDPHLDEAHVEACRELILEHLKDL